MADKTTITVSQETLRDFQTVHRFEQDNPSDSYDSTLSALCSYYFEALRDQSDSQSTEAEA